MKRFLLSLVALVVTSVCFAQDIIVQKDGSTIQAKVLKVSQSEVEYKKFGNLEGPTYTISTKDLQCINYENGTKDTFVSPNYNPSIVTNETATQFSNDEQLLKLYSNSAKENKRGKTLKTIGFVGGGAFIVGGLALILSQDGFDSDPVPSFGGVAMECIGLVGGIILVTKGCSIQKKARLLSTTLYQQEFKVGKNDRLMVGVDMLKDNTRKNHTLGLGVSYNF